MKITKNAAKPVSISKTQKSAVATKPLSKAAKTTKKVTIKPGASAKAIVNPKIMVQSSKKADLPVMKMATAVFSTKTARSDNKKGMVKLTPDQVKKRQAGKRSPRKQGGPKMGILSAGKLKAMAKIREMAPTTVV